MWYNWHCRRRKSSWCSLAVTSHKYLMNVASGMPHTNTCNIQKRWYVHCSPYTFTSQLFLYNHYQEYQRYSKHKFHMMHKWLQLYLQDTWNTRFFGVPFRGMTELNNYFCSLHFFSNACPIFVLSQATRVVVAKGLLVLWTTVIMLENNKLLPSAKKNAL